MRSIAAPTIDDTQYLTTALESGDTDKVLGDFRSGILFSYVRYRRRAPNLSKFREMELSTAAKSKMLNVYQRTVDGSLVTLREELKANCRKCPSCNISTASDLDHFLPKDEFPSLALFSRNLIPCCTECNRNKERGPLACFIHPYYDDLSLPILRANVTLEFGAVVVTFSIQSAQLPSPFRERIENHYNKLDLKERYNLEAQERLSQYRLSLFDTHQSGGVQAVRQDLQRKRAEALFYGPNHWEAALLDALIASNDYCDGGFSGL